MSPPIPPTLPSLPTIPYLRLRLTLRAEQPATLPPYQGSMLRGAFGHALRELACVAAPQQPCQTCRLRRGCHYTRLFETFIDGEPPPFLRGLDTAPRPYVFEPHVAHLQGPPLPWERGQGRAPGINPGSPRYAPGDPLGFDLLLFGQAVDLAGWALLAVERMAKAGLGPPLRDSLSPGTGERAGVRGNGIKSEAGLGARRARFTLDRVLARDPAHDQDDRWIVLRDAGRWTGRDVPPPSVPPRNGLPGERITLRLQTPLRLPVQGSLATRFSVRNLAFPMLRRVLELATFHVPGAAPDWAFRPLLEHAGTVRITASDLRWSDLQRYSNRQGRKIDQGGLLGHMELEGDLAPLTPLLRTAEIVHVGKGATFGLGKVALG